MLEIELQRQSILGKEKHDKLDLVQNDDEVNLESELVLEDYAADDVFDASSNPINDINQQDHVINPFSFIIFRLIALIIHSLCLNHLQLREICSHLINVLD